MQRYACKFCIALHGLKGTEVPNLPHTREEVMDHLLTEHRYPGRSALEVFGSSSPAARLAAELIENGGPIVSVVLEGK